MMGRSHAMCGLAFGMALAGVLGDAPLPVRLLVIPVSGGAALLPDLDHPQSRVARSLGPVTKLLAHLVAGFSLAVYHGTCADRDSMDRKSGHRTLTHTVPGCVFFGVLTTIATLAHPGAVTVILALLIGLLAQGFETVGVGFTLTGAGLSWWTITHYPGWSWVWPMVVVCGALVHVAGDWPTVGGVPILWPLVRDGRRWGMHRAPVTFTVGSEVETHVVVPLLAFGMVLSVVFSGFMDWAIFHHVFHPVV